MFILRNIYGFKLTKLSIKYLFCVFGINVSNNAKNILDSNSLMHYTYDHQVFFYMITKLPL